jgi:hypothetical protein
MISDSGTRLHIGHSENNCPHHGKSHDKRITRSVTMKHTYEDEMHTIDHCIYTSEEVLSRLKTSDTYNHT